MNNPLSYFYTLRSYVEAYAGLIGRRFISVIWVVAVCVVVWFYGYLLAFGSFKPLVSVNARVMLIAAIITLWLIYLAVTVIRHRRRDAALVEGIEQNAEAEAAASRQAEVGEIHARLKDALQLLRRVTKKRFGYIYQLPWYVIFGAPGSGKTTALTNSGLSFPLGDALGANSVQGIGGTRNCNWWFTDDAILIDTAGRYTTHDDLNGTAKAGWEGFLGLLRKYRRSQPVNGALVTLSIGDLMERDPEAQREEIRIIRQRLAELDEQLQVRVPVYLVLTKADLLTGFIEFFDSFNRSDREQVWGTTFSLEESYKMSDLPGRVSDEFAQLQERIGALLLERLQQEPSAEVRGRIFRFPAAFATLRERLQDVIEELCAGSKLVEPPLLRGIYFASGTQVSEATASDVARPRRSYFLTKLFKEVIFGEASLVARDRRLTRRQLMLRRSAYAVAGVAVAVVMTSWIATYVQNRTALASAERRLDAYEDLVRGIPVTNVSDTDFLRILPALDNLAAVPADFEKARAWPLSFGLDQQAKIEGRQRDAYQRALNALLLPRMLVQLQNDMQAKRDPNLTFDALKLYGMLGGLGRSDPSFVERQAEGMFSSLYPGDAREAVRANLTRHASALAAGTIPPIELDNRLIADARERIRSVGVADRAFHILTQYAEARALPAWTPASALGPLGERAFVRRSGVPLREGVGGIFTAPGYQTVAALRLDDAARDAMDEEWVRGEANPPETTVDTVGQAAMTLYKAEFERQWRSVIADLTVKPSQTIAEAAETTRILASEPNPVDALLRSIAATTDLATAPSLETADSGGIAQAFAATSAIGGTELYAPLREMLASESTAPDAEGQTQTPMQQLVAKLGVLSEQLSRAATSSAELAKVFDVDSQLTTANQDLLQLARDLPAPADTLMAGVAADIGSLAVKSARADIAEAWRAEAANYCESVVTDRFPFERQSERDVALADFVRLFAPNGLLKTFFDKKLTPFVDTTTTPWSWKGTFGSEGIASEAIAQFGYADQITRAFFPNGAEQPQVSINVTPVSLSQSANAVKLELGGQPVVYFHGPVRSKAVTWPSAAADNSSSLTFQPGGWQNGVTTTGDWSLFRLFDRATLAAQGNRDLFRANFESNGLQASFDIQFGSVLDPFRLPALAAFSCPKAF